MNSRIRRRNKCGFKGVGTTSNWVKTTEYGDYKAVKQNHKLDTANPEQYNIIHRIMKLFGFKRHIGSLRMKTLRMYK